MSIEVLCAVLSIITAVVAIIAPVITTIIHNKHDLKIQSMQFSATNRLALYQDFLDILNTTLTREAFTKDISLQFKQSFSKVYIVCSDSTRALLDQLENYISVNANKSIGTQTDYRILQKDIVRALREDLKDLR